MSNRFYDGYTVKRLDLDNEGIKNNRRIHECECCTSKAIIEVQIKKKNNSKEMKVLRFCKEHADNLSETLKYFTR